MMANPYLILPYIAAWLVPFSISHLHGQISHTLCNKYACSCMILANLTSRGTVKPQIITKTSTQQAAKTTAPASAPKA